MPEPRSKALVTAAYVDASRPSVSVTSTSWSRGASSRMAARKPISRSSSPRKLVLLIETRTLPALAPAMRVSR
jgi:hypothetical protein